MESSRRALIAERVLGLCALAAALGAAWAESGAPLARARREHRDWLAWVEARTPDGDGPPSFLLASYDPDARRLELLHVPGDAKLEGRLTVDRAYFAALKADGDPEAAARAAEDLAEKRLRELSPESIPSVSGRLSADLPALGDGDEPAAAAAFALKASGRSPRAWARRARAAWSGLRRGDRAALDPLLFALELRAVPLDALESARLPEEAQAPALLGRLFASAPTPDDGRATTAEVLNGTPAPGLASRAAKMLRLKGVDVLGTGPARARARTLVYDRVGDFRRASLVRADLDCPSARAVTRVDAARAVDVSVELGEDCAGTASAEKSRTPQGTDF
jgi:hypothetical protein